MCGKSCSISSNPKGQNRDCYSKLLLFFLHFYLKISRKYVSTLYDNKIKAFLSRVWRQRKECGARGEQTTGPSPLLQLNICGRQWALRLCFAFNQKALTEWKDSRLPLNCAASESPEWTPLNKTSEQVQSFETVCEMWLLIFIPGDFLFWL